MNAIKTEEIEQTKNSSTMSAFDQRDEEGWCLLHRAVDCGDLRAVERLLAAGADPNVSTIYDRQTSLHLASQQGHFEIVRLLVGNGAWVDAVDIDG